MKRLIFFVLILGLFPVRAEAAPIRWVEFHPKADAMAYAMQVDMDTAEQEIHVGWLDILALSACRTDGKCPMESVKKAARELSQGKTLSECAGSADRYAQYYRRSFGAALGGFLGNYAIFKDGQWHSRYGLKAFSPIAEGWGYQHYDDFGAGRSFGFQRKHLGNDLLGTLGTPIVAVEGGIVEAMGWNRYGGWRVGIRSADGHRYYYYAHLRKDHPFAQGLQVGDLVDAGDCIGYMGRTGYSDTENTNNIEAVHLHFGMELIFEEYQKECDNEIWIDVYEIVRLLSNHRSSLTKEGQEYIRKYPYRDLDVPDYPSGSTA